MYILREYTVTDINQVKVGDVVKLYGGEIRTIRGIHEVGRDAVALDYEEKCAGSSLTHWVSKSTPSGLYAKGYDEEHPLLIKHISRNRYEADDEVYGRIREVPIDEITDLNQLFGKIVLLNNLQLLEVLNVMAVDRDYELGGQVGEVHFSENADTQDNWYYSLLDDDSSKIFYNCEESDDKYHLYIARVYIKVSEKAEEPTKQSHEESSEWDNLLTELKEFERSL